MMKDEKTADRTVARLMDEITGQGERGLQKKNPPPLCP